MWRARAWKSELSQTKNIFNGVVVFYTLVIAVVPHLSVDRHTVLQWGRSGRSISPVMLGISDLGGVGYFMKLADALSRQVCRHIKYGCTLRG